MPSQLFSGLVLAGGKGTRMKSDLPKCAHKVGGLPMAAHSLRALNEAGSSANALIVGHKGEELAASISIPFETVWQREQLGTGHAVSQASEFIASCVGDLVVLPGDAPLISSEAVARLLEFHRETKAAATAASVCLDDPTGYGRIVRADSGRFSTIIEEKDASPEIKAIREVGVSVYCFQPQALLKALPKLSSANAQKEFYLVDILSILLSDGLNAEICKFDDSEEFMGVNDRWQLAQAEMAMNRRILISLAKSGVTIRNPNTVTVEIGCHVEPDCTLLEGTVLKGDTWIGEGSEIGPCSVLSDAKVGSGCKVTLSHLTRCRVGSRVKIGPFANIRPHSEIGDDCKIGNYVEVKNSKVKDHVSASHLSYLGDADIGPRTNIGAGTIFCNYDGFSKHRTEIGAEAFIGSNSTLVAPVTVGSRAMVAAGSVVTADVPDDGAAFGRARTEIKEQWSAVWRQRMRQKHELLRKTEAAEGQREMTKESSV